MYQNRNETDQNKIVYVTMSKRLPTESLVGFLRERNPKTIPYANDIDFRHGGDRYDDQPLLPDAKLLFVSEGWLLTMLMMRFDSNLERFQYLSEKVEAVIMDEVHERTTEGDLMCAYMRNFLQVIGPRRSSGDPRPKLVLMSATLCPQFRTYFQEEWNDANAGQQSLQVQDVNREDKKRPNRTIMYLGSQAKPFNDECVDAIIHLKKEYVNKECAGYKTAQNGNILVFLPSVASIKDVADKLRTRAFPYTSTQIDTNSPIIQLHGQCEPWVRELVQWENLRGRVILATNIVESSITISNLVAAVDGCRQKNKMEFENANALMECYATQSALTQREGRVSRGEINAPRGGMVIRLISKENYDKLPCPTPPQVLLTNIMGTYVKIRSMDMGDISGTKLMSTIKPYDLRQASSRLQELGVLDYDDNITLLGKKIQSIQSGPLHATAFLWCLACVPEASNWVVCSATILAVNAKSIPFAKIDGFRLTNSVDKNWMALSEFIRVHINSYCINTIAPTTLLYRKDLFENYKKFAETGFKFHNNRQNELTPFIPKDPTLLDYLKLQEQPDYLKLQDKAIAKMQYIYLHCFMPQLMIWCTELQKYINLETDQQIMHVDARLNLIENGKQARVVCYLEMEYVESKRCFTAHHTFALTANMIAFAQQHNQVKKVPDTYAKSILMNL